MRKFTGPGKGKGGNLGCPTLSPRFPSSTQLTTLVDMPGSHSRFVSFEAISLQMSTVLGHPHPVLGNDMEDQMLIVSPLDQANRISSPETDWIRDEEYFGD